MPGCQKRERGRAILLLLNDPALMHTHAFPVAGGSGCDQEDQAESSQAAASYVNDSHCSNKLVGVSITDLVTIICVKLGKANFFV